MGNTSPTMTGLDKNHPHYNRWKVEIVTDHYSLQPKLQGNMPLVKHLLPEELENVGVKDDSGYLGRAGRDVNKI
jgi:hypothetical protein